MTTRSKVAETNAQIQTLRHHMFDECVPSSCPLPTGQRSNRPRARSCAAAPVRVRSDSCHGVPRVPFARDVARDVTGS
jgi:hypothetical protein